MKERLIALCADEVSARNPSSLGLEGEVLTAQPWLRVFSSGADLRDFLIGAKDVDEVWIASCDDIEPINLAASVKADCASRKVRLVLFDDVGGSLASRMQTAGLDAPLSRSEFARRYAQQKALARMADPTQEAAPADPPHAFASTRSGAGFLMPVVSGSGGAGKSTVSVLSAFVCQQAGRRTLLVDFDLQFGDVARLAGMPDAPSIDDVMADPSRIDRLAPSDDAPAVLAAPRRLEDSELLLPSLPSLIDALLGRFDVVVANTGAFWAEQHAVLLERSSRVIFLVDQRPSSLRACQHALDLCVRCGIATGQFVFAANRFTRNALFTSVDLACALSGSYAVELADGGSDVEELVGAGLMRDFLRERNAFTASVRKLMREILPDDAQQASPPDLPQKRRGLFRRKRDREEADDS